MLVLKEITMVLKELARLATSSSPAMSFLSTEALRFPSSILRAKSVRCDKGAINLPEK